MNIKKTGLTALIALAVVSSMVAAPVMAAGGIGWGGDSKAPNPALEADVTVDEWNGADFDSALEYYDDAGDPATLPAHLNESNDNPITLTATDIDVDARGEFPRKADETDNGASALDASEWTTSGASVTSTTTAPGVDAVEYQGSASSDSASYANMSIEDAEKAVLTVAADVSSTSGTPTITVTDADGDYVEIEVYNASADATNAAVLANSTGEGQVVQTQLGTLEVQGSGDGALGTAESIEVSGDATVAISMLDMERTSPIQFGERLVENEDDELEAEAITDPHGEYAVSSLDTLDALFDDATIYGVTADAVFAAEDLGSEDVSVEFRTDNDYPQWDAVGDFNYRLELPSAFDLSYANAELVDEPTLPADRFLTAEIAEGTGDTAFGEVDSYTSVINSYNGQNQITLDDTVSADTSYVLHYEATLTSGEVADMESAAGGGGPMSSSGGGLFGFIFSLPGMILTGIAGFLGLSRLGGS